MCAWICDFCTTGSFFILQPKSTKKYSTSFAINNEKEINWQKAVMIYTMMFHFVKYNIWLHFKIKKK